MSKSKYDFLEEHCSGSADGILWYCQQCSCDSRDGQKSVSGKIDYLIQTVDSLRKELAAERERANVLEGNFQQRVREIINEERDKEKRKDNIILFNIPEVGETKEEIEANDSNTLNDIIQAIDRNASLDISSNGFHRLGQKKELDKPRPIKVVFKDGSGMKRKIMKAKDDGKWLPKYEKVKAVPDRTQQEREEYRELVKKLIRRKDSGESNLFIRNMQIVNKSSVATAPPRATATMDQSRASN